jgi:prolipoprotein diacylglyceryl transferase
MFYWNPDPVAFTIPILNLPVYIYGICFVTGFVLGHYLFLSMMKKRFPSLPEKETQSLVDQITWFVIGGALIGARLGHVFFYDWEQYRLHPWQILNTREGGLASHGGAIGIVLAVTIYFYFSFRKKTHRSFLELLDLLALPTALAVPFIRIGNFFNQEIIGIPTNVPWAVIFGAPVDHAEVVPRHPAQLYEAFSLFVIFGLLWWLWKSTRIKELPGVLSGLLLALVFGSRFLIEYVKAEQTSIFNQSVLQAGQLLSIPFIIAGIALIGYATFKKENASLKNNN